MEMDNAILLAGQNHCLICKSQVAVSKAQAAAVDCLASIIKLEIPEEEGADLNNGNANSDVLRYNVEEEPENHSNLAVLFELLDFSSTVRSKLFRESNHSHVQQANLFCTSCLTILIDTAQVLNQLRSLQIKLKEVKSHVQSLINSSFCGGGGPDSFTTKSQIDHLRQIIVAEIAGQSKSRSRNPAATLSSSSPVKRKRSQNQLKFDPDLTQIPLKDVRVNLIRLTEDEIQNKRLITSGNDVDEVNEDYDADFDWNDVISADFDNDHNSYSSYSSELDELMDNCLTVVKTDPTKSEPKSDTDTVTAPTTFKSDPTIPVRKVKRPSSSKGAKRSSLRRKQPKGKTALDKNIVKKKRNRRSAPVKCPECDLTFRGKRQQSVHTRSAHSIDIDIIFPFTCLTCKRRYTSELNLQDHLKRQSGECKKPALPESISYLTGHGIKRFKCNICNVHLRSRKIAEEHTNVHTKEANYICDTCGSRFRSTTGLDRHILRFHYNDGLTTTTAGEQVQNQHQHPFKCSYEGCGKIQCSKYQLIKHEKQHRGEFNYLCSQCDFKAVTLGILNKHMKIHSNDRPFKCEQCGKSYKRSDKLKEHVLEMHANPADRPFHCSYCTKTFSAKYKLDRHEILHTNEKPKKCQICGKGFALAEYVVIHMKHVHKKEPRLPRGSGSSVAKKMKKSQEQEPIILPVSSAATEIKIQNEEGEGQDQQLCQFQLVGSMP